MRVWFSLFVTLIGLLQVPGLSAPATVEVRPGNPRQGEAFLVRLPLADAVSPTVRWLQQDYPMYAHDGSWMTFVPIRPETAAGGHTLRLTYRHGGQEQRLARRVEVQRVQFPVQRLRMSPGTASLYSYPGVEKENALVSGAVRTLSDRRLWRGNWALPVKGRLSTPYGVRRLRNGRAVGRHRGLDIAAPKGTPILAPAHGKVVLAGMYRKHGGTVVLDHGQGVTSMYLHMSAIQVKKGQTVLRGARLGKVGSTGVSTGPHLHWSVYAQGQSLQPMFFCRLSKRGVVL